VHFLAEEAQGQRPTRECRVVQEQAEVRKARWESSALWGGLAEVSGDLFGQIRVLPGPSETSGCALAGKDARMETYSNCRAAMLDGKPWTMQVISHGRSVCRAVLVAPPFVWPLCWLSLKVLSQVVSGIPVGWTTCDVGRGLNRCRAYLAGR